MQSVPLKQKFKIFILQPSLTLLVSEKLPYVLCHNQDLFQYGHYKQSYMISATERNSNEHRNVKYAKIRRLITKTKINTTKIFRASSTANVS